MSEQKQCCSRDHNHDGNCDRHPVRETAYSDIVNLHREPTDRLLPCPFCGGTKMTLENTHAPCYWIECPCGAEFHTDGVNFKSMAGKNSLSNHKKAKQMAIDAWNQRARISVRRPRFIYGKATE